MLSCNKFFFQIIVPIVNIIISLVGMAIIAVGVIIKIMVDRVMVDGVTDVTNSLPITVPLETIIICIIVVGVILFLLGMFGCIGACCRITWALIVIAIGVSILAAGKIYLLVILIQFLTNSTEIFRNALTEVYNTTNGNVTLYAIEYIVKCCGIDGPETYESAGLIVPPTCCAGHNIPIQSPGSTYTDVPDVDFCPGTTYDGCVFVLSQYTDKYGTIVKTVLISIIAVEVADVLFDIISACFGKRKR